ncbi:hypothetical protein DACRYDRAFT_105171 [Dacryopinax primogenitus]|uniref:Uncharacterized protein n=1 Tax=Dacryopinax primogenitus (strain DJM 731) TaxID=1858805 RepID=M5GFF5_DACPD|nr:uncharacterized protein DACRYDRAFT_105171 [Dacryopinax primogenitus]EJU04103.1 hypothetical protein DACRYDRAFT_105171 [Dacryopinax primogenitus]
MHFLRVVTVTLLAFVGIALAAHEVEREMTNAQRLARGLPPAKPQRLVRAGPRAPAASLKCS